jgi:ankyrin repeat protein
MKLDEWDFRKNKNLSRRKRPFTSPSPSDCDSGTESPPAVRQCHSVVPLRGKPLDVEITDPISQARPSASDTIDNLKTQEQQQLQHSLRKAVISGQLEEVIFLLSRGASPIFRNGFGNTALHDVPCGTYRRRDEEVALGIFTALLDYGGDPSAQNYLGYTPLHYWATSVSILECLIPKCSNINIQTNERQTPLHLAILRPATTGCPAADAVSSLIKAGADVDISDEHGCTPFLLAVKPKYRKWYKTPTDIAMLVERSELVNGIRGPERPLEIFLQNPHIEGLRKSSNGILTWVALVRCFVSHGANPNSLFSTGERLLIACLRRLGPLPSVSALVHMQDLIQELCTKSDPKLSEVSGDTLLHLAARNLPFDSHASAILGAVSIRLLVEQGADPNARNLAGATPLTILLQRGIDVFNETRGYLSAIQFLLDAGANLLQPDDGGDCPLYAGLRSLRNNAMRDTILESCLVHTWSTNTPSSIPDSWWSSLARAYASRQLSEGMKLLGKIPKIHHLNSMDKKVLKKVGSTIFYVRAAEKPSSASMDCN